MSIQININVRCWDKGPSLGEGMEIEADINSPEGIEEVKKAVEIISGRITSMLLSRAFHNQ